jgi:hypothetical protein
MNGDYPSSDFEIADEGRVRKVLHVPTGVLLETERLRTDPIAVSAAYAILHDGGVDRPGEIVQAALRHLRVWLMRNYRGGTVRASA